ncbi:MFS transporter [Pseudoduganella namucuonensis]|nr:MFS transporter [Pseudoduganella namucuonensis]
MLQPLRHRRFRQLWLANLVSNLGTWTQTFASAWLVASISASPRAATLVQAATYAPMVMFGLLAGVVADAVPRARLLFVINAFMALAALCMAALAAQGDVAPGAVLALIFMTGTGSAFMWPAWQATTSALVAPEEVDAAASLNNLSYNAAAIAGPALGGVLFVWIGPAPLFLFNALSFGGMLLVYSAWMSSAEAPGRGAPVGWNSFMDGLRAGLGSAAYRRLLLHTAGALFGAIAFASLLPLFVRDVLRGEARAFGGLMACLGVGAVLAAFLLPSLRARLGRGPLLGAALGVFGAMLLALPLCPHWLLAPVVAVGGVAWAAMVSTLNGAAQSSFPVELRARTLSIYLLAMALGQTLGSVFWGQAAEWLGVPGALLLAGCVMGAHGVWAFRGRI